MRILYAVSYIRAFGEIGDKIPEEDKADVKVLSNKDRWYGVTYKEDKPGVVEAFKKLKAEGKYPKNF